MSAVRGLAVLFAGLLSAVNDVAGVERIRFASPHPRHTGRRPPHTRRLVVTSCPDSCAATSVAPTVGASASASVTVAAVAVAASVEVTGTPARPAASARATAERVALANRVAHHPRIHVTGIEEVMPHEPLNAILLAMPRVPHPRAHDGLQIKRQPLFRAPRDIAQVKPHRPKKLPGAPPMPRHAFNSAA